MCAHFSVSVNTHMSRTTLKDRLLPWHPWSKGRYIIFKRQCIILKSYILWKAHKDILHVQSNQLCLPVRGQETDRIWIVSILLFAKIYCSDSQMQGVLSFIFWCARCVQYWPCRIHMQNFANRNNKYAYLHRDQGSEIQSGRMWRHILKPEVNPHSQICLLVIRSARTHVETRS